jgi:hypothetical protein
MNNFQPSLKNINNFHLRKKSTKVNKNINFNKQFLSFRAKKRMIKYPLKKIQSNQRKKLQIKNIKIILELQRIDKI